MGGLGSVPAPIRVVAVNIFELGCGVGDAICGVALLDRRYMPLRGRVEPVEFVELRIRVKLAISNAAPLY